MLTLTLQTLTTLAVLLFAVASIAVGRDRRVLTAVRLRWLIVGGFFLAGGLHTLLQDAWAIHAFFSGPGSAAWNGYLAAASAMNHSRAFAYAGFFLSLIFLVKYDPRRGWGAATVVLVVLGSIAGAFYGLHEGFFAHARHYPTLALIEAAGILFLGVALWIGMTSRGVDRYLWGSLAAMAVGTMMVIFYLAALSWSDVPGAWRPAGWHIHAWMLAATIAMVVLAARRYYLARRSIPVPGMLWH